MIKTIIRRSIFLVIVGTMVAIVMLNISYIPVREGKLYLKNANSTSTLLREFETGIHHIKADSYEEAVYAQGFAHAQDRLWQMETSRRLTSRMMSWARIPRVQDIAITICSARLIKNIQRPVILLHLIADTIFIQRVRLAKILILIHFF